MSIGGRLAAAGSRLRERALAGAVRNPVSGPFAVDLVHRAVTGAPAVRAERRRLRAVAVRDGVPGLIADLRGSAGGHDLARRVSEGALAERLRVHWQGEALPPLVFLHIMKVGGTSLRHALGDGVDADLVLTDAYLDTLALMPRSAFVPLRLLGGHLPYAALRFVPEPRATLVVLRDPVERSLSHFQHTVRDRPDRTITLDEWAHSPEFAAAAGSYAARQLGHDPGLDGAWTEWSPLDRWVALGGDPAEPLPLLGWFQATPTADDEELHAQARQHLDEVDVVGTTERLDDVARAVSAAFRLGRGAVGHLNVTPERGEVPAAVRRRLEAITEVDRALYDRARERVRELD